MPDMMAIVSKAVFEKDAPGAKLGAVLPLKVYRSASKHLGRLDGNSRLFLVTVRPPDEALWLVAILESPRFDGNKWSAAPNRFPITDIGGLKGQLKFESGKGIQAAKGALGMSLQTPRALTPADTELLVQAASAEQESLQQPRVKKPRPINLASHEDTDPLPCLCKSCLPGAPESVEKEGALYFRARAEAMERVLWFWVPAELKPDLPSVVQAVENRMRGRLQPLGDS